MLGEQTQQNTKREIQQNCNNNRQTATTSQQHG
jgi:hypothetical protein